MMILLTGNNLRRAKRGYTLVELLVSVVIIAVGLIGVFRPLLAATSALNFTNNYGEASRFLTQIMWEYDAYAKNNGRLRETYGRGESIGRKTVFSYLLNAKPLGKDNDLFEVQYQINWSETNRRKSLTRTSYVLLPLSKEHHQAEKSVRL